ncbi:MAG: MFS transporter, partial [Proteobacteria bacterium]|nr:MFS transporter [Pseudomonadota bacterium]
YLYYFLFGALCHASLTGPLYASASLWFKKNIGLAFGVAVSGSAFGQGVVPAIATMLIDEFGWRSAYTSLGIGYMCLAVPIVLLVRDSPDRKSAGASATPLQRDGTTFPLSPIVTVAWIASAVFFCCTAMSVPVVHLIPLLRDGGMSAQEASYVFLAVMIAGMAGRIFGGNLCDRIGSLRAYALMSLCQTSVIFIFPHVQNMIIVYVLAMAFGVFFSGVMASFLVCVRMMVPPRVMARSMSVVGAAGWFGMGFGGWQGGAVFDITGNYTLSFANGSFAGIVNLLILAAFYFHIRDRSGPPAVQAAPA